MIPGLHACHCFKSFKQPYKGGLVLVITDKERRKERLRNVRGKEKKKKRKTLSGNKLNKGSERPL
jgi:hypothetical protein